MAGWQRPGAPLIATALSQGILDPSVLVSGGFHATVSLCVLVPSVVLAVVFGLQEVPAVALQSGCFQDA